LKLRKTIGQYKLWFPKKLAGIEIGNLDEQNEEQLKEILQLIKFQLSANNSVGFNKIVLESGLILSEELGKGLGFKINGLSNMISNREDIDDLLKEIALQNIENGWYLESPYSRLGIVIFSEGTRLHNFNLIQENLSLLRNKFVSQEIIDKYNFL
jgi:hypothetical protein